MYAETTDVKVEMTIKEAKIILTALLFAINNSNCKAGDREDMREMVYELAEAIDADVIEDEDEEECEDGEPQTIEDIADTLEQMSDELRTNHGL